MGHYQFGQIFKTYDPEAGEYPMGYEYDVSLVEPDEEKAGKMKKVTSPVQPLSWIDARSWRRLRLDSTRLKAFEQGERMKILPYNCPSDYLVCGPSSRPCGVRHEERQN